MATYPIRIWTIREQHDNGYQVNCWCWKCRKFLPDLDHVALIAGGHGDKPVLDLRLKCACGTPLQFNLQPPSRHAAMLPPRD